MESKNSQKTARGKGKPFEPGDKRINRKGRPPLSQKQREFRQKLHSMDPSVIASVRRLVKAGEPSVVNKMVDKLSGIDPLTITLQVEKEHEEFLQIAKEVLPAEVHEKLLAAYAARGR